MPTYEYHCDGCGQNVDIFQSMSSAPEEICPNCGAKKLHRLISGGSGIIFKGSGFYCTDYKKSSASTSSINSDSASSAKSEASVSESSKKSEKSVAKKTAEKAAK